MTKESCSETLLGMATVRKQVVEMGWMMVECLELVTVILWADEMALAKAAATAKAMEEEKDTAMVSLMGLEWT